MKKGFTLVELLVAATIIGLLAAFATAQYRNSVAEGRWTYAKAQADQLAAALQRIDIDYPNLRFETGAMKNASSSENCQLYPGRGGNVNAVQTSQLIACGYLENSDWQNPYFSYYICTDSHIGSGGSWAHCTNDYVCMGVKDGAALPSAYQKKRYCVDSNGVGTEDSHQ